MTDTILKVLVSFEERVLKGEFSSFMVFVKPYGVLLKSTTGDREEHVTLSEEMLQTLHNFFFDLDGIAYDTPDYTNLKSLLNARVMLDKISGKP